MKCPFIHRFNAILIQISMAFSTEIKKESLKLTWNYKIPWIVKMTLTQSKAGGITHPDFKTCCKTTVIETVLYWHKDKHVIQWSFWMVYSHFTVKKKKFWAENKSISSVTQLCPTLQPHGLQHVRLPCPSSTPGDYSN